MSPTGSKEINYENIFNLLRSNINDLYDDLRNKLHEEVNYKYLLEIGEQQFFNIPAEVENETEFEISNSCPTDIKLLTATVDEKIDNIIDEKLQGDFLSSFKEEVLKSILSYKNTSNNLIEKPAFESELLKYEVRVVLEKIDDLNNYCAENMIDFVDLENSGQTKSNDAQDDLDNNNNSSEITNGIRQQSEYHVASESQEINLNNVSENDELDGKNVRFLQAKWTNIKDRLRKSYRRSAKYKYSDRLQFLYKSFEDEENFSIAMKSNALVAARPAKSNRPIGRPRKRKCHSERNYVQPPSPPESTSENEKSASSPLEINGTEKQIKVKNEILDSEQTHEKKVMPDDDEAFFISIMPAIKRLSEDEKLEFRMGVLATIRDIKKRSFVVDTSSMNIPSINSHTIAYPSQFVTPVIHDQIKISNSE